MIVDFHTHAFSHQLAEKAMDKLEATCGIPRKSDGTIEDTCAKMKELGVDAAVVLNIASTPSSTPKVNDFAMEIDALPGVVAFGSLHPLYDGLEEEICRLREGGLKGIKLHPYYQGFFVEDELAFPMYELLEKSGLYVCFHAGYDPLDPHMNYITPKGARTVHDRFPGMKMILAHLGSMYMWDEVEKYIVGTDIWMDTAFCAHAIDPEQLTRIIRNHGASKILLGSDFPWHNTTEEIEMIRSLALSQQEKDWILGENAKRMLHL